MENDAMRGFRHTLRVLEREIERAIAGQSECCGVSFAQCHTLLELEESDNLSVRDLAERLELDTSTLSRTLDKMFKDGLIERKENPEDRRFLIITLTGQARTILKNINGSCNTYYGRMFDSIPSEKHAMIMDSIGMLASAMRKLRKTDQSLCCKK
ncbi:MAG: MarR family transcriptional regulator [Brevinematales bacterium]|nr:MarR family transcriptional regulator [Brevinematales bacterium]